MHKLVPCNTGLIADKEGNILRSWSWRGAHTVKNPAACEQDDGVCIELEEHEYDLFFDKLHSHKFDFNSGCVVCKETGVEVCKVKSHRKLKNAT